jgi:hypothetical protein
MDDRRNCQCSCGKVRLQRGKRLACGRMLDRDAIRNSLHAGVCGSH